VQQADSTREGWRKDLVIEAIKDLREALLRTEQLFTIRNREKVLGKKEFRDMRPRDMRFTAGLLGLLEDELLDSEDDLDAN
jgi:hypothetical protein